MKFDGWTEQAQWWKIGRRANDASYLELVPERVTQSEVLEAVKNDCKEVVLVYASDDALTPSVDKPAPPLEVSEN